MLLSVTDDIERGLPKGLRKLSHHIDVVRLRAFRGVNPLVLVGVRISRCPVKNVWRKLGGRLHAAFPLLRRAGGPETVQRCAGSRCNGFQEGEAVVFSIQRASADLFASLLGGAEEAEGGGEECKAGEFSAAVLWYDLGEVGHAIHGVDSEDYRRERRVKNAFLSRASMVEGTREALRRQKEGVADA